MNPASFSPIPYLPFLPLIRGTQQWKNNAQWFSIAHPSYAPTEKGRNKTKMQTKALSTLYYAYNNAKGLLPLSISFSCCIALYLLLRILQNQANQTKRKTTKPNFLAAAASKRPNNNALCFSVSLQEPRIREAEQMHHFLLLLAFPSPSPLFLSPSAFRSVCHLNAFAAIVEEREPGSKRAIWEKERKRGRGGKAKWG